MTPLLIFSLNLLNFFLLNGTTIIGEPMLLTTLETKYLL